MTRPLLVVSDLHIAPDGPLSNFHAGSELAAFCDHAASNQATLVLNGDTFDLLQEPDRPETLSCQSAVDGIRELLGKVRDCDWGSALFDAIGAIPRSGGRVIVLPGNHDPELFVPAVEPVIREALGLSPNDAFEIDRSGEPWRDEVEGWKVVLGHGHRPDPVNDIVPAELHTALEAEREFALPPGSLLVLRTLNAFKEAVDADGKPRFGFVDKLKPETSGVMLLLLYLDPKLFFASAPVAARALRPNLMRAVRACLKTGPALGPQEGEANRDGATWFDDLAHALGAVLRTESEDATEGNLQQLDQLLVRPERPPHVGGGLAQYGGLRLVLRAAMRALWRNSKFFGHENLSELDERIVIDHLPPGKPQRVAIAGHTHAAREVELPDDRFYLNTGTWTDLLSVPPDTATDQELMTWIDDLEAGRLRSVRSLTYAEITAEGPRLVNWTCGS